MGFQFDGLRPGSTCYCDRSRLHTIKRARGDGNSYYAPFHTSQLDQHVAVRAAIVSYMVDIAHFMLGHCIKRYSNIYEYVIELVKWTWHQAEVLSYVTVSG